MQHSFVIHGHETADGSITVMVMRPLTGWSVDRETTRVPDVSGVAWEHQMLPGQTLTAQSLEEPTYLTGATPAIAVYQAVLKLVGDTEPVPFAALTEEPTDDAESTRVQDDGSTG
jgi:hypothetical protein